MLGFASIKRHALLAAAGLAALTLAGCTEYGGGIPKHLRPLSDATKQLLTQKGMDDNAPILVRIFKEESVLEVWKQEESSSRYALLQTYDICKWSGNLGPKMAEGDRQAPEGFYAITPANMNPNSNYYLSFNLGYPNAYDRSLGRTGSHLMVHGACSSAGCYSMTDDQIQEIYTLGRLAFQGGQRDFQLQAFPFRMTPENMARYRNDANFAFWEMLKEGYDHFEVIRQPPKVDVCGQQYVFNSVAENGVEFSPTASCPPMSVPDPIRIRVAEREARDQAEFIEISARLDARDARQAEAMVAAVPAAEPAAATAGEVAAPMSVAAAPVSLEPSTTASLGVPAPTGPAAATEPTAVVAASQPMAVTPAQPVATAEAAPAQQPVEPTAYVQEPERRGFFGRMISAVNPF